MAAARSRRALRRRERDRGEEAGQQTADQHVLPDDDLANFLFEAGDDLAAA